MTPHEQNIIEQTKKLLKDRYGTDTSGHDWFHLERVWKMAKRLAKRYRVNEFVLEMAALLHDVDDHKIKMPGEAEFSRTESLLAGFALDQTTKISIYETIRTVSYKGEGVDTAPKTLEGKIVQDADRLEAMGAIGIARTFSYNGHKGNLMYDPGLPARKGLTFARYKSEKSTAINHFSEKLLLLKDRMNTPQARPIAEHRHRVLEEYLKEFFTEVEGRA